MFKTPFCEYNLYWIGPRESDIEAVKGLFSGSITFFGDGNAQGYAQNGPKECRGNIALPREQKADHNDMGDVSLDKFVMDSVKSVKEQDPYAKFLMYNANVLRPHSSKNAQDKVLDPNEPKGKYLFSQNFYDENYICVNDDEIMEKMDSKISFHNMFVDVLGEENMLEIQVLKGKEIDSYHQLCQKFDVDAFSGIRFIVQENFASGGAGTHIVEKPRHGERLSFNHDDDYICSILQEDNISVNAHVIVFDKEILILPASIQIICENNKRLMYRGADFIAYRQISQDLRERFEKLCITAAKEYQKLNFRGILGLDAIIHENKVKMLECNNRFQSSSNLLNYALNDAGLPSLQEMCYLAWSEKKSDFAGKGYARLCENKQFAALAQNHKNDDEIEYVSLDFKVNYSNFNFIDSGSNIVHARRMYAIAEYFTTAEDKKDYYGYTLSKEDGEKNAHIFKLEKDGYQPKYTNKAFAHLFRISFDTNICAVSPEGTMRINDNIRESDRAWSDKIYDFDPLATKISLLVQGVVIDKGEETRALIEEMGGYREATNEAIDLNLKAPINLVAPSYTELVVNAPLNVKFASLSPFSLRAEGELLALYYYNKKINDNICVFPQDPLCDKVTSSGTPYRDIAFLSGDRLRVHATSACHYKATNAACKFCNMPFGKKDISSKDIEEVVNDYLNLASENSGYILDHFLVGGQSVDPEADQSCEKIINVIKTLRSLATNKRIYVMATPPKSKKGRDVIVKMVKAGAREFSFNMEIFNVNFAKKYMPGKANDFSRESYVNALSTARFILDDSEKENVRTMFVVGLEPITSLKQGVKLMINNDIQPMLSVFRPLPGTELEELLPPQLNQLYQLYLDVEKWCEEKGIRLGPECRYCQNNTLSLPY